MRILEIGDYPYVSSFMPAIADFHKIGKGEVGKNQLTLGRVLALRKRLRAGDYDLVVYHLTTKALAPWHRAGGRLRGCFDVLTQSLFRPHRISWHYLHYFLEGTQVPLVVVDPQDVPRITKSESFWLDRARFWFMRELPPNHLNLFLNMDRRSGDVVNIGRNPLVRRNLSKIEPFSLGFDHRELPDVPPPAAAEKKYDVFYAGANHTTTVRQRGMEELRVLAAEGVRVFIPETRLSREEFLRTCSQSWLVWSPEGQGWDCHRHYEALVMHSVPLINYPTIEHWQPLIHGTHCLYHRPEAGGLTEAVRDALRDTARLPAIAAQGRAHVLQHHTRSKLARHVLEKAGFLSQVEPHWVE
jgi:hypothetical protein